MVFARRPLPDVCESVIAVLDFICIGVWGTANDTYALFVAVPLDKAHLFNAKFVPFKDVQNNKLSGENYSLDDVVYRAADGSLLDVYHDMDALANYGPDYWKSVFDSRIGTTSWPFGSGVWSKKEWILPVCTCNCYTEYVPGHGAAGF